MPCIDGEASITQGSSVQCTFCVPDCNAVVSSLNLDNSVESHRCRYSLEKFVRHLVACVDRQSSIRSRIHFCSFGAE